MNEPEAVAALLDRLEQPFRELRTEAPGGDLDDPTAFATLPGVQGLLEQWQVPAESSVGAVAEYLSLLFVLYRFWAAGRPVLTVPRPALEAALDANEPLTAPVPDGACYVTLPVQFIWGQVDEHAPHEPMHGLFLADGSRGPSLTILAVLGARAQRGGMSQVALTVHPSDALRAFQELGPEPFAPAMDGGAQAGFRSVRSAAELLVLSQLALAQARR